MRLFAEDALETTMPWLRWEMKGDGCKDFVPLHSNPHFDTATEYRRKPKTIRIGGRDVPEPMRNSPATGERYYVVEYSNGGAFGFNTWVNDQYDNRMLQSGLCHTTKEAAIAHAEALILVSGGSL
jgi:hypothetical protein